jgi:hypothetical protein
MAKNEVEAITRETIEKGGLLVRLYFDMQSERQEDLQPLMTDLISNRLLKAPGVVYCFGSIEEPIKVKDVYSTGAILTALFKDFGSLVNVAFSYAPAGIEIIKPDGEIRFKTSELQGVLLDVARISVDYSDYILSRVLSKEDYEKVLNDIKNREALGKRLIEKKHEDAEKKD